MGLFWLRNVTRSGTAHLREEHRPEDREKLCMHLLDIFEYQIRVSEIVHHMLLVISAKW